MSFENADSNIIDGKVQNLSQSRVQYALSAFKPTECLNWVNYPIFTRNGDNIRFVSHEICLTFLSQVVIDNTTLGQLVHNWITV